MTRVKEHMNHPAIVCQHRDSAMVAAALMLEHDYGVIPIVNQCQGLVGIVTDRDVCMAAYTEGMALRDISLTDIMTRKVLYCGPHDSLKAARERMERGQVRRLPVVDQDGHVIGVLSAADLLHEDSAADMLRFLTALTRSRRSVLAPQAAALGSRT